jgi:hypothetical protein
MNWDKIVKKASPHIVRVETPAGYGTGFLILYNEQIRSLGDAKKRQPDFEALQSRNLQNL